MWAIVYQLPLFDHQPVSWAHFLFCWNISIELIDQICQWVSVTASFNEPMPGWMENWYGPTGICYMAGIGALRTRIHGENLLADIIPVDLVSNMLIAAAWQTAQDGIYGVKVYNCVSGARNPITWGQLFEQSLKSLVKNPLEDVVRYPQLALRSNRLINAVYAFWAQTIPALAMDLLSRIMGKRPRYIINRSNSMFRTIYLSMLSLFRPSEVCNKVWTNSAGLISSWSFSQSINGGSKTIMRLAWWIGWMSTIDRYSRSMCVRFDGNRILNSTCWACANIYASNVRTRWRRVALKWRSMFTIIQMGKGGLWIRCGCFVYDVCVNKSLFIHYSAMHCGLRKFFQS